MIIGAAPKAHMVLTGATQPKYPIQNKKVSDSRFGSSLINFIPQNLITL